MLGCRGKPKYHRTDAHARGGSAGRLYCFTAGHISFVSFGRLKRLALQSKADLPLALVGHNLRQREGAGHKLRLQSIQPLREHNVKCNFQVTAGDATVAPLGPASACDGLDAARVDDFINLRKQALRVPVGSINGRMQLCQPAPRCQRLSMVTCTCSGWPSRNLRCRLQPVRASSSEIRAAMQRECTRSGLSM